MDLMENILRNAVIILVSSVFLRWLLSSSKKTAAVDENGMIVLVPTRSLYVYGIIMVFMAIISLSALVLSIFLDMDGAGLYIAAVASVFFFVAMWGLYAGFGGRVRYDDKNIFYLGLQKVRDFEWRDMLALRDGAFSQYIQLADEKLIISKGLLGFRDFALVAKSHGVKVDASLIT